MGAAESNVNRFANRIKKQGYSWSLSGLDAMLNAMRARFEGRLRQSITRSVGKAETKTTESFNIRRLIKQKSAIVHGSDYWSFAGINK
jgi:hypothetical protein